MQEHFVPWAKKFWEPRQRSQWKEMTDTTNQAYYPGVGVAFLGIPFDTKQATIQKRETENSNRNRI